MDNIQKYFDGEKLQCILGIIIGSVCILTSIYFLFLQKPMLKGVAYSVIPLSILLLTICIGIVIRTPNDLERVITFYKDEPQKIQTDELPRMEKVMKNFAMIMKVEIFIFAVGLLLATFFWKYELVKGVAIGLMLSSSVFYLFDYIAAKRGETYLEFLKSL
jgi:membrane glycosyltransferase